jgi:hypothetical protein
MEDKHGALLSDDRSAQLLSGSRCDNSTECRYDVVESSRSAVALLVREESVFHSANSMFESVRLGYVGSESSLGGSACHKEDTKAFSASLG